MFWFFFPHGKKGRLQLIAIHLITLHNILVYMQIAIIKTEAAEFVKINILVLIKNFGHSYTAYCIRL